MSDIAVVITAHNYAHYLGACLDSVFAQTLLPKEVVVVDDASTDNTSEVVQAYPQVRYFKVDFCNGNRARNFGFSKTSCREIVFFDADNVMMPKFLLQLHEALQQDHTAAFAYCDRINFGTEDVAWYSQPMGRVGVGDFDRDRLAMSNYIDLAALIRRDCFPGFDESLRRYQDWDLWLNIVLWQDGRGCYVPEPLFRYRVHGNNVSRREKRDLALWAIRKKYRIGWGRIPLLRNSYWLYCLAGWIKRCLGR